MEAGMFVVRGFTALWVVGVLLACGGVGGTSEQAIGDELYEKHGCIAWFGVRPDPAIHEGGGETTISCADKGALPDAVAVVVAHCADIYDADGYVNVGDEANNANYSIELSTCTSKCDYGCW